MGDICCDNRFEIIKKAKDELLFSTNIDTAKDEMKVIDSFLFRCWQMGWLERYDKPREPLDIPTMTTDFVKEHGLPCPEGYEFRDENGNVINATKIVLEKKKKEYPKSYEECCEILDFKPIHGLALQLVVSSGFSVRDTQICTYERNLTIKLEYFRKLLICRDAYWKIAGDWKPEFGGEPYYCIMVANYKVDAKAGFNGLTNCTRNTILAFPTEEMRDAFYENFKEIINECKELL